MVFLKHNFLITVLIIIVFYTTGCAHSEKHVKAREVVLSPGITLCATQNTNNICITADKNNKRIIKWENIIIPITLIPRQKRWHGKLGLVAPNQPKNLFTTKKGLIRILFTEAQIHNESKKSFIKFIKKSAKYDNIIKGQIINRIYRDDGLHIAWKKVTFSDHITLDIMLFQEFFDGKKPQSLPGSQNNKILVTY